MIDRQLIAAFSTEENLRSLADPIAGGRSPRVDQIMVAEEIIKSIPSLNGKGKIVEIPTGGGKTLTAMITIRWLVSNFPGIQVGFMVHRRELFYQTLKEFNEVFGKDRVDLTAGRRSTHKPRGCIRVYMEQTVATRFSDVPDHPVEKLDLLFIDEAHSMNYRTFIKKWLDSGTALIGLSATPDDWRLLEYWEEEKIVGASQSELERDGVLVEPVFFTNGRIDAEIKKYEAGQSKQKPLHFENARRHIVDEMHQAEAEAGASLKWVIKTQKKKQAIVLAEDLTEAGFPARAFYSGGGGGIKAEMDSILDGKSEHRVAVVVQRFAVGYDHPGIGGIVLTGAMKYSLFVQTVGRALRPGHPRVKDTAYIVDLAGNLVHYQARYLKRRSDPTKKLPMPPEPKEGSGAPRPPNTKEFEEEKIHLHKVILSHIDRNSSELDFPSLVAYCAVSAEEKVGAGPKYPTARARKTKNMLWLLTGKSYSKEQMRDAIVSCPNASMIWRHRAPMPDRLAREMRAANMDYAKKIRMEYGRRKYG